MADLLTHVLVAYSLATLLSWRYAWLTPSFVTVAMVGAMIPDLSRLALIVPVDLFMPVIGISVNWEAFHVLGGSLLAVALGTLVVPANDRRRVGALLAVGVTSHHALDLLLLNVSGYSYAVLWPLTGTHPPSLDLYLSTDRWPAICSAIFAAGIWYAHSRRSQ